MDYRNTRNYTGPVRLVIFDWAGTTVDYGCRAPAAAFVEGFARQNVTVTMEQAREPMGMEKRDHIRAVAELAPVAQEWRRQHGRGPGEEDIDAMYRAFVPVLLEILGQHGNLIEGVVETVDWLRRRDVRVAASTGYFTEAADIVAGCAETQGYVPDFSICASEVPQGRPAPWMLYRVMENQGIYPSGAVVNVGDTVVDIVSGRNAGCWSVGVASTGNLVGLSRAEFERLSVADRNARVGAARQKLLAAGAHYAVDGVGDLPAVIKEIDARLSRGHKP